MTLTTGSGSSIYFETGGHSGIARSSAVVVWHNFDEMSSSWRAYLSPAFGIFDVLPRRVSNAPTAAPTTATPPKIAAALHLLPTATVPPFCFTCAAVCCTGFGTRRGVLRLVERGFKAVFAATFRRVGETCFSGVTEADVEAGLTVEVTADAFDATGLRAARRRVTGFLVSVSGVSVSAMAILPQKICRCITHRCTLRSAFYRKGGSSNARSLRLWSLAPSSRSCSQVSIPIRRCSLIARS